MHLRIAELHSPFSEPKEATMKRRINDLQDLLIQDLRINDDFPEPQDPPEPEEPPAPPPVVYVTKVGTNGNDVLHGYGEPDVLIGLGGNDILISRGGDDQLYGGEGNDLLKGGDGADLLIGGDGNDSLHGEEGADVLDGGNGEDWISYQYSASPWGVVVDLDSGIGHSGDAEGDTYFSIENVDGSQFHDLLAGTAANNILWAGYGNDTVIGRGGDDQLYGYVGNDWLDGGAGADILDGDVGDDWITYATSSAGVTANLTTNKGTGGDAQGDTYVGIENIDGSAFADTLTGNTADNNLWGNAGNDVLVGREGNDYLDGGDGHDGLRGGAGADFLSGGDGVDTIYYQESSAGITAYLTAGLVIGFDAEGFGGDAEGDTYFSIENLVGSHHDDFVLGTVGSNDLVGLGGNDYLDGGAGNDRLLGGDGDDMLNGGAGADKLDGGNGTDTISYASSYWGNPGSGVTVNLGTGKGSGGDAQGDTYISIENVTGSAHNDFIIGNAVDNVLSGGQGNDTLIGGGGQDKLYANGGHDILTGDGNGAVAADTFGIVVSGWHQGSATITDFQQGVDKIDLLGGHGHPHATLQDFGSDGVLAWGYTDENGLHANALDATDKYFFDTSTDTLYECSFVNDTLVMGDAVATVGADIARLQTSDFLLV
jgi:Ca2+-binding RTX toxin-like protein